mgnify:CR=1 FL=1
MSDAVIEGRQGQDALLPEEEYESDESDTDLIEVRERLHETYEADSEETSDEDE